MLDQKTVRQRKYRVNNTWIFNNTANPPPIPPESIPDGYQDVSTPYFPKHKINKQFISGVSQISMPVQNQAMVWVPPIPRMEKRRLNYSFSEQVVTVPFIGDNQTSILLPSIPRIERPPLHQLHISDSRLHTLLQPEIDVTPQGVQEIGIAYSPKRRLNTSFTQDIANLPIVPVETQPDGKQWLEHLPLTRPNSNVYQDWSYRLPDSFIFVVDFSGVVGYYDRVKFPTYEETLPYPTYNESLEHPKYKDNVRWP